MLRRDFLRLSAGAGLLTQFDALPFAGAARAEGPNPFLSGGFAPVQAELTAADLPVTGRIPAGLDGVFRRNGPNPAFPPLSYTYPFDGDGMVHAVTLRDGKASYRNRFVETPELGAERRAGRALYGGIARPIMPDKALLPPGTPPGPVKNVANTNIIRHGGRLLALYEASLPHELDEELRSKGPFDFAGALTGSMTAHPFIDPASGEMVFYRYRARTAPHLTLFIAGRSGKVTAQRDIDTDVPYMVHDFAVTERHVVFVLTPLVLDLAGARAGKPLLSWQPERGTRIAVLDRRDLAAPVAWRETEPFFVFHFLNAYDDRDAVVIDYVRYPRFAGFDGGNVPVMARMILAGGTVQHAITSSPAVEFPRLDERRRGRRHRWGYAAVLAPHSRGTILRFDRDRDAMTAHDFGPTAEVGEPVFVPRGPGAAEDDGWVMVFVYDRATDSSVFALLDARELAAAPVATIHLPQRVPHGLHGNWMPA